MATSAQLKSSIKQIESAMKNKALQKTSLAKFQTQLDRLKGELASLNSPKPKKGVTKTKVLTALQKLKGTIKSNKALSGYKKPLPNGNKIDIEKDANVPALKRGVRTSKGLKGNQYGTAAENKGRKYYEYRLNHADVKQPPKRYPKLEQGGMMEDEGLFAGGGYMAKGGLTEHGLRMYDTIISGNLIGKTTVRVRNEQYNEDARVDLNTGKRTLLEYNRSTKKWEEKKEEGDEYAQGGGLWIKSYADDKRLKALHQGKRISENGKVYYENRLDHADVDRRRRLEHGGEMHRLEDSI